LCDTMFTVSSTLMWAVLTGPTEVVAYSCIISTWWIMGFKPISTTNWFPSVLWHCRFGHLPCKNCSGDNLWCVEWDIKPLHYYYYFIIL